MQLHPCRGVKRFVCVFYFQKWEVQQVMLWVFISLITEKPTSTHRTLYFSTFLSMVQSSFWLLTLHSKAATEQASNWHLKNITILICGLFHGLLFFQQVQRQLLNFFKKGNSLISRTQCPRSVFFLAQIVNEKRIKHIHKNPCFPPPKENTSCNLNELCKGSCLLTIMYSRYVEHEFSLSFLWYAYTSILISLPTPFYLNL